MPEKELMERVHKANTEGKSPSTQAGEFVREDMHHVREGKHGAQSPQQAIAIGLSKARRAGVKLPAARNAYSENATAGQTGHEKRQELATEDLTGTLAVDTVSPEARRKVGRVAEEFVEAPASRSADARKGTATESSNASGSQQGKDRDATSGPQGRPKANRIERPLVARGRSRHPARQVDAMFC